MAQFTITIPNDKVQGLINAFATQYNYQDQIPNPEAEQEGEPEMIDNVSKAQFAKNIIRSFIREVYTAARVKESDTQRQQIIKQSQTDTEDYIVE